MFFKAMQHNPQHAASLGNRNLLSGISIAECFLKKIRNLKEEQHKNSGLWLCYVWSGNTCQEDG